MDTERLCVLPSITRLVMGDRIEQRLSDTKPMIISL